MIETAARPAWWMLGGAFAFAVMGAFTHALGTRCDWLVVAFARAVFMFTTAALMARAGGVRLVVFEPATLWMRSLAGSFSLVCNFYALARLPIADALTLTNLHPLWIVVLASLALRRPPSAREVAGVVVGLIGVALIQRPQLEGGRLATGVALTSSLSTAVAMIGLHRLRQVDARAVVAHFAGVASLVSGAWLLARGGLAATRGLDAMTWSLLLGVAVSGTLGQVCLTRAYASGPPAGLAAIGLTQVVFALGFDVVLWGRVLTPLALAGFVLVLAPTALLSGRAGQALARGVREATDEAARHDPPGRA